MTTHIHDAWTEYAREQQALRRRETSVRTDVSGQEALDHIIQAIGDGRTPVAGEARRARLSSERRERAHDGILARYGRSYEDDLRYRSGPGSENVALFGMGLRAMPARTARAVALDAQGLAGGEIALRLGCAEGAVRQCLSRAGRKMSS